VRPISYFRIAAPLGVCLKTPDALPLLTRGVPQTRDSSGVKRNHDRQGVEQGARLAVLTMLAAILCAAQSDSNVKPPVSKTDLQIVARAEQILSSPAVWNRNDNRECPQGAKTVSLYCALEQATMEVTGSFAHRGAVMQEARFAVDEIDGNRNYDHRLMGYNNDRTTTFEDMKHVFRRTRERIEERLSKEK
jgi:hypothetical protein